MNVLTANPDAVLVSAETVAGLQLSPGDLLNLRIQDDTTKKIRTIPFHYAGIVNEFPTAPQGQLLGRQCRLLGATDRLRRRGRVPHRYRRPKPASPSRQRFATRLALQATVTDISQVRAEVGSSLTSVNLAGLTRLELTFAVLLAAAAGGLVLAAGLAERRRSLAIISVTGRPPASASRPRISEAAVVTIGGLAGERWWHGAVGDARQGAYRRVRPAAFGRSPCPSATWALRCLAVVAALDGRRSPPPVRRPDLPSKSSASCSAAASRVGHVLRGSRRGLAQESALRRGRRHLPLAAAARSSLSSSQLPVWAARVVFLLGLLNIASAVVRRSPRLLDWSQDYLPPFGAVASVAVVGIGVGCGLLVMARGCAGVSSGPGWQQWRYSAQRSPFTCYAARS